MSASEYLFEIGNTKIASKLGFSGHETFPFRYGWLKKAVDAVLVDPFILSRDSAIVELGVGRNMVQSIRHWGLATQILQEGDSRALTPTGFGRELFEKWDPFLEDPASLWLIHYHLVSMPSKAATWHYVFNRFRGHEFSKRNLLSHLQDLIAQSAIKVRESSLQRDIDCFIRCYTSSTRKPEFIEDSFDCPLVELGLITSVSGQETYSFATGEKPSLPLAVVTFVAALQFALFAGQRTALSLSEVLYGVHSPGQVFKLDENSLLAYLEDIEAFTDGGWPICFAKHKGICMEVFAKIQ